MEWNGKIIVLALLLLPIAFAASGQETFTNSIGMNFVEVPGGGFWMGSTEVTQGQWQAVMGNNPSAGQRGIGDSHPVNQVSWYDTLVFANRLSRREGLTPVYSINGSTDPARWGAVPTSRDNTWDAVQANWNATGYRLPTEAEWDYAARGGSVSRGYTYAGSNDVNAVAWYGSNSNGSTHPVGTRQANELGLYDMSGNVWEWCWDRDQICYTAHGNVRSGAVSGSLRVTRGGSWISNAANTRSANREIIDPSNRFSGDGFRLVRSQSH